MAASYRSTDWFPSTVRCDRAILVVDHGDYDSSPALLFCLMVFICSVQGLSMPDLDKVENLATDHSVLHDQDSVSSRSLCGNSSSANSFGIRAKTFFIGGYEHAADTPWSYHSHADIIGFEKVSHGIYNEQFCYGNGLSSPDFQTSASTTTQPSLHPYGELNADDSRHFPAVDPSNCLYPIPENVHVYPQFQVSQANLPINSDRLANERSFVVTENMMCALGSSGLRNKIYREPRGLGFMPNRAEEFGVPSPEYSLKPFNGESSFLPAAMTRACVKHIGSSELFLNDFEMGSRHGVLCDGFESASTFSNREHTCNRCERGSFSACASGSSLENDYHRTVLDEARQEGSCNDFFCRCSASVDFLTERNRGPRASRLKGKSNTITHDHVDRLSQHDYRDAKFFVIKSYSEDNVHKSIKYGVWASTANGNKKLDAAYREAKEKEIACPVFLLFSVNASAQFCGMAEMAGPVDFNTSVEYWQQDRWTGHFPVKWLIIKDVPNSLFRHIILENNDNKPVTNSRDTQEVGLEQGLEMLNIFKSYEMHSSILDDFSFYEERQKAMQNRKARRRAVIEAPTVPTRATTAVPAPPTGSLPSDLVKQMSKSFAEALALNRSSK